MRPEINMSCMSIKARALIWRTILRPFWLPIRVSKSSNREMRFGVDTVLLMQNCAAWLAYSKWEASGLHYINLSGQDFPLKSQDYIRQFFAANPGKQFIRALDQRKERPDTMNRVSHIFTEENGKMTATGVARPFLAGDTPFIGTQWKAVTRSFCEFVCHDPRVERFKSFYRNSFIADEAFFQTVIMNSGDQGIVMNDDLRMIDWVPDGDIKLRPRNYDENDLGQLERSTDLFARKFDAEEDTEILSLLERHLLSPGASIYRRVSDTPELIAA